MNIMTSSYQHIVSLQFSPINLDKLREWGN